MRTGSYIAQVYAQNGQRPVAYLDETLDVDPTHARQFYVMTAVVVEAHQQKPLRSGLVEIAGTGYWHTTEAIRTAEGRNTTCAMLEYLADPSGSEECIFSIVAPILDGDTTGEQSRALALRELLVLLTPRVRLFILERRNSRRLANLDEATKRQAIRERAVPPSTRLVQASPGEEQLLWLPDLASSAYRQHLTGRTDEYFQRIAAIARIVKPRLP